mmetsp:Transcript_21681/g.70050  ORF Transcript_21681/g.70050 Transcript_21681/m.70050 type:complete len:208 (-) Transcript_21681:612-1235(-)
MAAPEECRGGGGARGGRGVFANRVHILRKPTDDDAGALPRASLLAVEEGVKKNKKKALLRVSVPMQKHTHDHGMPISADTFSLVPCRNGFDDFDILSASHEGFVRRERSVGFGADRGDAVRPKLDPVLAPRLRHLRKERVLLREHAGRHLLCGVFGEDVHRSLRHNLALIETLVHKVHRRTRHSSTGVDDRSVHVEPVVTLPAKGWK